MTRHERRSVVCFGGGTGLPSLLSGMKRDPWLSVTAVVNMFDDGGSSGVLRDRFGILPPGDVLKCLLALSEDEAIARKILLKRIENGDPGGHTGGNLLLLALQAVLGSHEAAVHALGQILSVGGAVVPVTHGNGALCADFDDGGTVQGEVNVDAAMRSGRRVRRLYVDRPVPASPRALEAIRNADAFCVGPGSLYTSILPNFLPTGITDAIRASGAPVVFIANLVTEGTGMARSIRDAVTRVEAAVGRPVERIIANGAIPDGAPLDAYGREGKLPLLPDEDDLADPRTVVAGLWTDPAIARHDSDRLTSLVSAIIHGSATDL